MVKPEAKCTIMSEMAGTFQSCSQEHNCSPKGHEGQLLAFPAVKYYPSTDLVLKSKRKAIQSKGLFDFLKALGISAEIAKCYFHEVCVYNKQTQEKIKTLGLPNEDEVWELVNPFFKGSIGSQAISFIRGTHDKPESIHVFKETLDFLAFLSKLGAKKIVADVIILHANTCVEQINPYIQNYGYKQVYSWMDNDPTGQNTGKYIQALAETEEGLKHKAMNKLYAPFKNVQRWYAEKGVKNILKENG
jgi:hypothetical protein